MRMNQQRELSVEEAEQLAALLSSLPRVQSEADVGVLPLEVEGVFALSLTDDLLRELAVRVPHLRYIATDGNACVTDAGLAALARFTRLEWLDLEWGRASDAGLSYIAGVGTLRWVDLSFNEQVTSAGVKWLRKIRPDLIVETEVG